MIGNIQFGGIASGLDTGAIIQALLSVEQFGIDRLESRKAEEKNKLSSIGTLEGLVKKLQTAADDLSDGSDLFSYDVSIGEEGYAAIEVSGDAQTGSHELEILALATSARFVATAVSDPDAGLGTGTISFDYGGTGYDVEITTDSDILAVADAINEEVGDIVTATVINTGTENNPSYELLLAGNETGSEAEIENLTITGLDSQGALSFTRLQDATNASLTLDGVSVTRASNQFDDLLDGYSFTLQQETQSGVPLTFGAEIDTAGTIENLQSFADAYNEVIDFINSQSSYSEEGGAGGILFGDSILGRVRSQIYNGLFNVDAATVAADTTGYSTLSIVGFEVGTDGRITLDSTTLEEKLTEDPTAFNNLISGEIEYPSGSGETVDGMVGRLSAAIDEMIDSVTVGDESYDGIFGARRDAINSAIKVFDRQIEQEEFRLGELEERLIARFTALEELLAGLQSQQNFLSAQAQ